MSAGLTLEVNARNLTGKKVRQLRTKGLVPGVIYGSTTDAKAVQVDWATLRPVLRQAGGTQLLNLSVDGESINVLVRDVQRHPVRGDVMHVDFFAIDVEKTLRVNISIAPIGLQAAAKRLAANIYQPLTSIDIECLPADIPQIIEVDLSIIKETGDNLTVSDLPELKGVTYLADESATVFRTLAIVEISEEDEEGLEEGEEMGEVEVIGRQAKEDDEEEDA